MPPKKKSGSASEKAGKVPKKAADSSVENPAESVVKKSSDRRREKKKPFPLVGIGSSAGGLESIREFFMAMPRTIPEMAFVVVSHLDPKHESILPDLIRKYTTMEVFHVENGMKVEPRRVYVIPPDADLALKDDKLVLSRIETTSIPKAPINHFFRSLAEQWGEMAVGIILSGMGSDGTAGIQYIKNELGMAMAQEPDTAKFNGMPESVIHSGLADYVLPPGEMPEQLIEYVRRGERGSSVTIEEVPSDFLRKIHDILRSKTGHDFSHYKESTVRRRVARRMNILGISQTPKYLAYLRKDDDEARFLIKDFLISVTRFFRDPEAFESLKEKGFPHIFKNRESGDSLRVWVAGCATGEEAYSVAIILQEYLEEHKLQMNIQIFATDLDEDAVGRARLGIYAGDISEDVSPDRLDRFFSKKDDHYRISPEIRERLIFAPQSIIKDPPFTRLDLICCRNFLIYLDTQIQKKVLPLFHYSLNPGGILFLGSSESISYLAEYFSMVDSHWKIFRRNDESSINIRDEEFPLRIPPLTTTVRLPERAGNLSSLIEKTLLDNFTPSAIVIDSQGNIRYIHGMVSKYLQHVKGQVTGYNAFEMAREGLKVFLITSMRKMRPDSEAIQTEVRIGRQAQALDARVTISPIMAKPSGLYVVLFEELHKKPFNSTEQQKDRGTGKETPARIQALEQELQATKEGLVTTFEELESSNEELRSANEEYQSTNEELQSANEELYSSKEELQSLNEELETVNAELHEKMREVEGAYDEMSTMLDGLSMPVIFLDPDLRIRRFSSSAGMIVDLIEADVGRPLKQLSIKTEGVDLQEEVRQVMETNNPVVKMVRSSEGKWYRMRIAPYHTEKMPRPGAVLIFQDIDELGEVSDQLETVEVARRYMHGIFQTVREPLLVLDRGLKVISANESFYRKFLMSENVVIERSIFELGNGQWDIPELRQLLEKVLPEKESFEDFEMQHVFPEIGKKKMRLNARIIHEGGVAKERILLAIEDVTGEEGC